MTSNRYLSFVFVAGVISWLSFFLVLFKLSPFESVVLALSLFFVSLFIALSATFAIVGFYVRFWLFPNELFYKHVNVSLRQGVFLGLLSVFALVFQSVRLLNWWSGFLLVAIMVLLEFYFASQDADVL